MINCFIPRWVLKLISTFSSLSLGRYLCWWIICQIGVDTSTGGLFVTEGSIPLLVDYLSQRGRYLCWWTICQIGVDTSAGGLCVTEGSIPLLVNYLSDRGRYFCWWTICQIGVDTSAAGIFVTEGSIPLLVDYLSQRGLRYMAGLPDIQNKVQEEIDRAVGK
jgi:hypothetical protein